MEKLTEKEFNNNFKNLLKLYFEISKTNINFFLSELLQLFRLIQMIVTQKYLSPNPGFHGFFEKKENVQLLDEKINYLNFFAKPPTLPSVPVPPRRVQFLM